MHNEFLLAALEQAKLGRGFCAPNPSVGAVAVMDSKIIARAWHQGAGKPHAEQLILSQLPADLSNVSLYVTLEPCNHWGRTPPCVDAIINYGIKQVIYAYQDPNPLVAANNTPEILKKHGVTVIHHPLPEVEVFYQSYRHWTLIRKPWVTAKIAQSFDGKIAGKEGQPLQITNALCGEYTHQQRKQADIILTTARTINNDDPLFNARLREGAWQKPIAILDRTGQLNPSAKVLKTALHCHIFHDEQAPVRNKHAHCSYYPIISCENRLNLEAILLRLGQLGFHDVWVEAGGKIFSELHKQRLVNRTLVYLAPKVLGKDKMGAYTFPNVFNKPCKITWLPMEDNMIVSLDWDSLEERCSQV